MYYAYNADGIRTAKLSCGIQTSFLLDGGDVVAEAQNDVLYASYLRGVNLICRDSGSAAEYYLFDAHADVIALTDETGAVTKSYEYDAFGCEASPDPLDANPFRYCGEYYDVETGSYYLRARYYAPTIGRFTQQDTHWSTANMIYGDNPQKINEKQDALGLNTYTMIPQITAVMQAGNLYVYGISNPVRYHDPDGQVALELIITGFSNFWNPVGIVLVGVGAAIIVGGAIGLAIDYAQYNNQHRSSGTGSLGGSTPASPLPPNNNGSSNFKKYSDKEIERRYGLKDGEFHSSVKKQILKDLSKDTNNFESIYGKNPDIYLDASGRIQIVATNGSNNCLSTNLYIQYYC